MQKIPDAARQEPGHLTGLPVQLDPFSLLEEPQPFRNFPEPQHYIEQQPTKCRISPGEQLSDGIHGFII